MNNHRKIWLDALARIARPVLTTGAAGELRVKMPVEAVADMEAERATFTHLEAVGRLFCGVAPWLELRGLEGDEASLRSEFAALARATLAHSVDPASPGFLNFSDGGQPIVDAAFLAQALLRAPRTLWAELDATTQHNICNALAATRTRKPHFNNWLLFAAVIETFLARAGVFWDRMRVDYALRQHMQWYLGDGVYGDGPEFHWDYYNSFVIQPMLVDVLAAVGDERPSVAGDARPSAGAGATLRRHPGTADLARRNVSTAWPLTGLSFRRVPDAGADGAARPAARRPRASTGALRANCGASAHD
jgi:hypothetical protein